MKFVSGGQTGVDRGVLDACLAMGFDCGGWIPEGRKAEDGPIDAKYPMSELKGGGYQDRTYQNVIDSDAMIIIICSDIPSGGTRATIDHSNDTGKPHLIIDMRVRSLDEAEKQISEFITDSPYSKVNWAGPRESEWKDGYVVSRELAMRAIRHIRAS